ncbi:hypothetical protein FS842_002785 [Serendipita sp. 407]|nr:hypothetical protein FS842_002785 [Serendipita sp. 407]
MPTPAPFTPPPVAPMPYIPPAPAPIFSPMAPPPRFEPHNAGPSLTPGNSTTSAWGEQHQASSLSGSSSRPFAPSDTKASYTPVHSPNFPVPANNTTSTTANPTEKTVRPQSPVWQDSSEALD